MQPRSRGHDPLNLAFVIDGTVRYKLTKNALSRGSLSDVSDSCVFAMTAFTLVLVISTVVAIGDEARVGT